VGGKQRGLRFVLGALAVAGLLISAYLTWTHIVGAAPVCISGSGGCETVQSSRYATILGIPVATLGAVAYLGLLFSAVLRGEAGVYLGFLILLFSAVLRGEAGVYLGFLIALVGAFFSAYLTYLEVFVIRALCQWCLASAAVMVGALVCAALRVRLLTQAR
jgi:uncharacterized membrane protein